ncbi:MAG: signal peptidase II, partial [bacterium]|nr:signal peptidase II [bacterium]
MRSKKQDIILHSLLAVGLFLLDRVTKYYSTLFCVRPCFINQFLSFQVTFNRGISWGMFHTESVLPFVIISLMIMITTIGIGWIAYHRYQRGKCIVGELLVIAGSVSNSVDRVFYAGVIDFIQLSYHEWTWPVFNIA